jgi:hypothetical protein
MDEDWDEEAEDEGESVGAYEECVRCCRRASMMGEWVMAKAKMGFG